MLLELGAGPEAVGALVVGIGPGTFTGVRITVATARALAFALARPVVGVSTLSALAAAAVGGGSQAELIVPIVDARRGQVFYGLYEREEGGSRGDCAWVRRQPFSVCDRAELSGRIGADRAVRSASAQCKEAAIVVVGESAALAPGLRIGMDMMETEVSAETLLLGQQYLKEPAEVLGGDALQPWLGAQLAGRERFSSNSERSVGAPGTPEAVKPLYVRAPDADIHITKMRDPWASTGTGVA
jgi:tRNA threonylcarbamoyl adenosine modification protein YeaZ